MTTRARLLSAMVLATTVAACESTSPAAQGPPLPTGAITFTPPAVYQEWWTMTEQCRGAGASAASLDNVQWFVVPDVWEFTVGLASYAGWYDAAGNRIVVAGHRVLDGRLVRHEMLHAQLGHGYHERDHFVRRCGGTVVCNSECLSWTTAPIPDPSAVVTNADAMDVSLVLWPTAPSADVLDGYIRLTVKVRNPATHPVIVAVPAPADDSAFISGYQRTSASSTGAHRHQLDGDELAWFGPGETRQYHYDLWIGGAPFAPPMPPEATSFTGMFAGRWTDPIVIDIPPAGHGFR